MTPLFHKPPRIPQLLLNFFLSKQDTTYLSGDFDEIYNILVEERGRFRAAAWYCLQLFISLPAIMRNIIFWRSAMFLNTMKLAFRHIRKHPGYSAINVLGLAVGIAVCILAFAWMQAHWSTDQFHDNIEAIHIVRTWQQYGDEQSIGGGSVPALGPALKTEYPEILNAARFFNNDWQMVFSIGDQRFKEHIQFADLSLFDIFTFPLTKGNLTQVREDEQVLVLSESLAEKFYGNDDPMGKVITLDNAYDFRVVGVMKDLPQNSTIRFDVWVPLVFMRKIWGEDYIDTWTNMAFRTYVELVDGASGDLVNDKIKDRIQRSDPTTILSPMLYPFEDYYIQFFGVQDQIRMYGLIAGFILLIACINYMNLATARAAKRAREVGLRKVVGAERGQIIRQFFGESLFFTILAMIISLILAKLVAPGFSNWTQMTFRINPLSDFTLFLGLISILVITTGLSGYYPALMLSSFRPAQILRGSVSQSGGSLFRKILVVIQYSLSIILIIGTCVIVRQSDFMKNMPLGYDKEHLIYIPIEGDLRNLYASVKQELLNHPNILNASLTSHSPDFISWSGYGWTREGKAPNINPRITYFCVDGDFQNTFRTELAFGRSFRNGFEHDGLNAMVNERFAELIGKDLMVGTVITHESGLSMTVIGVMKDFNFKPASQDIEPMIMLNNPEIRPYQYLFMRFGADDISETLHYVQETVERMNPGFPFEYHFLDNELRNKYVGVDRLSTLIQSFAILAIVISCLGLFGLATYMAEQRTKEVGVRKVLGASVSGIIILLSMDFVKWVVAANVIAWPLAYWLMRNWLNEFASRIQLSFDLFLFSAMIAVLIALLTVSSQAMRAARTDPVSSLKYE